MSDPKEFRAFSIQGRLYRERERLAFGGMTEEERSFRKQWIKDQILSKNEPVDVPELRLSTTNIFKRIIRKPLDYVFEPLKSRFGVTATTVTRSIVGKMLMSIYLVYAGAYYFKYNQNDWTRKGGWRVLESRPAVLPGEKFESKVKYFEQTLQEPKQEEDTSKTSEDIEKADQEAKKQDGQEETEKQEDQDVTETPEDQEENPSTPDDVEEETQEKTEKPNETISEAPDLPSHRTLGSYYASRGFENSPL